MFNPRQSRTEVFSLYNQQPARRKTLDAKSSSGIGLHKTAITIAAGDSAGEPAGARPFPPRVDKIDRFFPHFPPPVR